MIIRRGSSKLKPGIASYLAHNFTYTYSSNNYALLPKMKATTILSFFGLVAAAGKFPPRPLVEHRTGWNYLLTEVPLCSRRWYVSTLAFARHRKKKKGNFTNECPSYSLLPSLGRSRLLEHLQQQNYQGVQSILPERLNLRQRVLEGSLAEVPQLLRQELHYLLSGILKLCNHAAAFCILRRVGAVRIVDMREWRRIEGESDMESGMACRAD